MNLLKEIENTVQLPDLNPSIKSRVFEDNEGVLKVAKAPSITPQTKHFALELHHFRTYVESSDIIIEPINTKMQLADILIKPVGESQFLYLRKQMIGE